MLFRNLAITALSLSLVFLLTGLTFAQERKLADPWFFIQLTDPQFGMFDNNESFDKETVLYEQAVAHINRLMPDFLVITGDFVHNGRSDEQIQEFMRITGKINPLIPIYYTPGNHDVGLTPDKERLKRYEELYGKDRFSFKHNGSLFVGFNTSLIKAGLKRPERKQYRWLKSELRKGKQANHIILFCHYPFFTRTVDEPEKYSNIGPEYRMKYLSLFDESDVTAVFSGHYHNNALNNYGNVELVITSAAGKPLGDAPSGMRVVKVFSDRVEHEYYGFDDFPGTIEF